MFNGSSYYYILEVVKEGGERMKYVISGISQIDHIETGKDGELVIWLTENTKGLKVQEENNET